MPPRNLADLHESQARRLGPRTALRYKKHGLYHDISWSGYRGEVQACASALVDAGIQPGDRVGLLAENRVEWLIADLAIMAAGAINVPPHAPLTAPQIAFQFQETDVRWVFVSTILQLEKIEHIAAELPELQGVVIFDNSGWHALRSTSGRATLFSKKRLLSWNGFLQRGCLSLERNKSELTWRADALGPDDLATIIYTSGTTGNPKGVMLTHGNLLSNAWATNEACPRDEGSVVLNWLPFSHIYARTVDHYLSMVAGIPLCLAESAETLVQNLAEIQPTHFASVPRFYEKILVACPGGDDADRRLRDIFGSRIEWLNSGGAPLPLAIAQAYKDAGLLLLQGYGLTESSPVISFNHKNAYKLESVGRRLPGVEVRIADDGEVLTRGPHVMKGYWKNSQATAEAIQGGWLYTGDLGVIDADGFLTITGRKKDLIVLSSGKKVAPNQIEALLTSHPYIEQAVVCGEGRNFLTAVIVPNWQKVRVALPELNTTGTGSCLASEATVHALIARSVAEALANVGPWEQVKKFIVAAEPFSVAADEITVSLKIRRQAVLSHHQAKLHKLYDGS